jgi:SAM-dependent methyltransferase
MNDPDVQTAYWDGVAGAKTFTHPIPITVFRELLPANAKILDYGCGYGRTCSELAEAGYTNVIGIDISGEMIRYGKSLNGDLDLRTFDGNATGFDADSFDACLLIAVLTCIPSDIGHAHAIEEVHRLLKPGGLVFLSDYPLQTDARNQQRYLAFEKEMGIYGMFRTEGAVVRHHDMQRIHELLSDFEILNQERIKVSTMNGSEADVFQITARKRAGC